MRSDGGKRKHCADGVVRAIGSRALLYSYGKDLVVDMQIRKAGERGRASFGWLESRHTFSFGQYYDPDHMGFGPIRVINDDRVAPGGGFPTHAHSDMEIVTYVLDGALEHRDSLGTGSIIRVGDVQRMSAGRGIRHSEYNASKTEPVHFLQIWVTPESTGIAPSYEQKSFGTEEKRAVLSLVASMDGRLGSVTVHRDLDLYATLLSPGERVDFTVKPGRGAWIQIARGIVKWNATTLDAGDGAGVRSAGVLALEGVAEQSEVLVFDFAA